MRQQKLIRRTHVILFKKSVLMLIVHQGHQAKVSNRINAKNDHVAEIITHFLLIYTFYC